MQSSSPNEPLLLTVSRSSEAPFGALDTHTIVGKVLYMPLNRVQWSHKLVRHVLKVLNSFPVDALNHFTKLPVFLFQSCQLSYTVITGNRTPTII